MTPVNFNIAPSAVSMNTKSISEQPSFVDLFKNISKEGQNRAESILAHNMSEDDCNILDENGLITTDIDKLEQILFADYPGLKISNSGEENSYVLEYDSDADGTYDRILEYTIDEATGEMIKDSEKVIDYDNGQELSLDYWNGEVADVFCWYGKNNSYSEDTSINAAEDIETTAGNEGTIHVAEDISFDSKEVTRSICRLHGDSISHVLEFVNGKGFKFFDPTRGEKNGDEYSREIVAE